jgi:hypothetical protein
MARRYATLAAPAGTTAVVALDTDPRVPVYMPLARAPPLCDADVPPTCPAGWLALILEHVPAPAHAACRATLRQTLRERLNRTWMEAFLTHPANSDMTMGPLLDALVDDALPDTPGGYTQHVLYASGQHVTRAMDPGTTPPTALGKLLRHVGDMPRDARDECLVMDDDLMQPDLLLRLLVAQDASLRRGHALYANLWVNIGGAQLTLVHVAGLHRALKEVLRRELPTLGTPIPTLCLLGSWAGANRALAEGCWRALVTLLHGGTDALSTLGLVLPAPPHYDARAPVVGRLPDAWGAAPPRVFVSVRDPRGAMQVHVPAMTTLLQLAHQLAVAHCDEEVAGGTLWPLFTLLAATHGTAPMHTWPDRLALLEARLLQASAVDWLDPPPLPTMDMGSVRRTIVTTWPVVSPGRRHHMVLGHDGVPQAMTCGWLAPEVEEGESALLHPYLTISPWHRQ